MGLEENRKVIYGAQSLAGKILVLKSLVSADRDSLPVLGPKCDGRTVTASMMMARSDCGRQGQMSQRGLWKSLDGWQRVGRVVLPASFALRQGPSAEWS